MDYKVNKLANIFRNIFHFFRFGRINQKAAAAATAFSYLRYHAFRDGFNRQNEAYIFRYP